METQQPRFSVDEKLRDLVSDIDVDFDALAEFYGGLPHPNKQSLDGLHMHISGRDYVEKGINYRGYTYWKPENINWANEAPELEHHSPDRPLVVTYLGTIMRMTKSIEAAQSQLNGSATHELTHYAQGRTNSLRNHRYIQFAVTLSSMLAAQYRDELEEEGKRDTFLFAVLNKVSGLEHAYYRRDPIEVDARAHESPDAGILHIR